MKNLLLKMALVLLVAAMPMNVDAAAAGGDSSSDSGINIGKIENGIFIAGLSTLAAAFIGLALWQMGFSLTAIRIHGRRYIDAIRDEIAERLKGEPEGSIKTSMENTLKLVEEPNLEDFKVALKNRLMAEGKVSNGIADLRLEVEKALDKVHASEQNLTQKQSSIDAVLKKYDVMAKIVEAEIVRDQVIDVSLYNAMKRNSFAQEFSRQILSKEGQELEDLRKFLEVNKENIETGNLEAVVQNLNKNPTAEVAFTAVRNAIAPKLHNANDAKIKMQMENWEAIKKIAIRKGVLDKALEAYVAAINRDRAPGENNLLNLKQALESPRSNNPLEMLNRFIEQGGSFRTETHVTAAGTEHQGGHSVVEVHPAAGEGGEHGTGDVHVGPEEGV